MSRNATIMVILLFTNRGWFLDKLMFHQKHICSFIKKKKKEKELKSPRFLLNLSRFRGHKIPSFLRSLGSFKDRALRREEDGFLTEDWKVDGRIPSKSPRYDFYDPNRVNK